MAEPSRPMSPPPGEDWESWNPYKVHPTDRIVQYTEDCGRLVAERLEEDGVAIIKGLGLENMVDELTEDFGKWLAQRGVDMRDNTTWCKYTNERLTMSPSIPGMMNTGPICFSKVPLKTRCHPAVQQVFASLYNVRREDLVMELGGVFYGFPPEHHEGGKIDSQPTGGYHHWSEMWMHSDRGRDVHATVKLQCTIQLSDAGEEDHVFAFMSRSHLVADEFFSRGEKLELENENKLAMQQASGRVGEKDNFIQLSYPEVKWFEERGCKWSKVVAPKGCVIIWDGRLIHSTCKPMRGRREPKPRFIVYGGLVPRNLLTLEDYYKRQARASSECVGDAVADVSALMRSVPLLPSLLAIDGPPPFLLHYHQEQQRMHFYGPSGLPPGGPGKRGKKRGPASPLSHGQHKARQPKALAHPSMGPGSFLSVYPPAAPLAPFSDARLPTRSISSSEHLFRLFLTAPLLAQSHSHSTAYPSSMPLPRSPIASPPPPSTSAEKGDAPLLFLRTQDGPLPLDKPELQLSECRALRALLGLKRQATTGGGGGTGAAPHADAEGAAAGPSNAATTTDWAASVFNPIDVHEPCGASFLNATLP